MLALGNEAKVLASIDAIGSDLVMIRTPPGNARSSTGSIQIVDGDIEAIELLPGVQAVVGEDSGDGCCRKV